MPVHLAFRKMGWVWGKLEKWGRGNLPLSPHSCACHRNPFTARPRREWTFLLSNLKILPAAPTRGDWIPVRAQE